MNAMHGRIRALCAVLPALLLPLAASAGSGQSSPKSAASPAHTALLPDVILLHGLGRSEGSMRALERGLEAHGYAVHNLGYPSRDASLAELADGLADEIERCCSNPEVPLDFVTHSMGGILLRTLLGGDRRPANLGRVVMLAPPNQGSEWVDELRGLALFRLAGPAAAELGTDARSVPRRLGPVDFELGVLAGNRSWNPLGSWLIPGADDGTVAVAHARVAGMSDFRVLPTSHHRILRDRRALAEVVRFLEQGAFSGPHEQRGL